MPDPRTHLPVGNWRLRRTNVQLPDARCDVASFFVVATDLATRDHVQAYVTIGDLGGYSHEDWGLPSNLPVDRVWHLANLNERSDPKARGGTTAAVRYLAQYADSEDVWLTTEVKPHDPTREQTVMALLKKHADFISPDLAFAAMMIRTPR